MRVEITTFRSEAWTAEVWPMLARLGFSLEHAVPLPDSDGEVVRFSLDYAGTSPLPLDDFTATFKDVRELLNESFGPPVQIHIVPPPPR